MQKKEDSVPSVNIKLVGEDVTNAKDKFFGCSSSTTGQFIFLIPCNAKWVMEYNTTTNKVQYIGDSHIGDLKWWNAVDGGNGKLYGVPYCAQKILEIDTHKKSTTTIDVQYEEQSVKKSKWLKKEKVLDKLLNLDFAKNGWVDGVKTNDEKICFIPYHASQILVFDPTERTATFVGKKFLGNHKWSAGLLGLDGCVYGIPYNASKFLRYDPKTKTTTIVGKDLGDGRYKWRGGCITSNGIIYGAPDYAGHVVRFDPKIEGATLIGSHYSGDDKWRACAMLNDNTMVCAPCHAKQVLIVNTITNETYLVGDEYEGDYKWAGATKDQNGDIYCAPYNHNRILKITLDTTDHPVLQKLSTSPTSPKVETGDGSSEASLIPPPSAIDAETGQKLRSEIINLVGNDVDDYFPKWATSYATDNRRGTDAQGCGPGMWINYEIIKIATQAGFEVPMTGMLFAIGNWQNYMLRIDAEACEMMGEENARLLVVLLSKALLVSNPCMDEIHKALESKLKLIVLRCDDDLPPRKSWWPLPEKKKKNKSEKYEYMLRRQKIVTFLSQENTIPTPGRTIMTAPSAPRMFLKELRKALSD